MRAFSKGFPAKSSRPYDPPRDNLNEFSAWDLAPVNQYVLAIEQWAFGAPNRPFQRNMPIHAVSDSLAIQCAIDYADGLFLLDTVQEVRADLQDDTGNSLHKIALHRSEVSAPPRPVAVSTTDGQSDNLDRKH